MPRRMRRESQQVNDIATLESWLKEALVGRLATVDEDGYPVIKPVNFVYDQGRVFFHSALEGEKLDDIRREARVGFEIDKLFAITPPPQRGCQTHCFYQSVIIRGKARLLAGAGDRPTKERALWLLVEKYSSASCELLSEDSEQTAVVEIEIDSMTGKEDFGQKWSHERKLTVARLLRWRDGGAAAAEAITRMGLTMAEVTADAENRTAGFPRDENSAR